MQPETVIRRDSAELAPLPAQAQGSERKRKKLLFWEKTLLKHPPQFSCFIFVFGQVAPSSLTSKNTPNIKWILRICSSDTFWCRVVGNGNQCTHEKQLLNKK